MPPLWLRYPHIHQYSIGWRMGYGESYRYEFHDWFGTLSDTEQKQYQSMFPLPKTWRRFYDSEFEEPDGFFESGTGAYGIEHWNKNGTPRYSKDWLINKHTSAEYVFFWKPGDIEYEPECCLGQWQYSEFRSEHLNYKCTEQYMMAEKARLFEDVEIEKEIMKTTDPKQMKSMGRKVKNFHDKIWDRSKYSVVLNGNYLKFTQNPKMRNILLATGDKVLVEASPLDKVWGIGFSKSNSNAVNPSDWRGLNLLGFALMEVRDEIKNVYRNYDKINWSKFEDKS